MAKTEKYQVRKIQGNGHMHKNKTWYEKLIFVYLRSFLNLKKWEIAYMG